uniref:Uncharacterized protein n=2 Tax=Physcomitrium patens TaxID=3218 RepID=A0A2K1L836_PHYPA|nr:hypothetical protein PHYPA_000578 [Physcomitrium patens]
MGCNNREKSKQNSPKDLIMAMEEWETMKSTSRGKVDAEEIATSPEWRRDNWRLPEQAFNTVAMSPREVTTSGTQVPNSSEKPITTSVKFDPSTPWGFSASTWYGAKTSRALNKPLADGWSRQNRDCRKPAALEDHPIFATYKRGYMMRNVDLLTKQTIHQKPNLDTNKLVVGLGGLGPTECWRHSKRKVPITQPVFFLQNRGLMTVNLRLPSVGSPGLTRVARGWCSDSSRVTASSSWGTKGLKIGPGFRCTCMYPGHGHTRELQIDNPIRMNSYTRTMTVDHDSKFSTLLKNLKSAYDSDMRWKSIAHFKFTRRVVNAIR